VIAVIIDAQAEPRRRNDGDARERGEKGDRRQSAAP
jgi:hypothetical protein